MTLRSINPATGDEITSYPVDTPEIIEEKIARAVTAEDTEVTVLSLNKSVQSSR